MTESDFIPFARPDVGEAEAQAVAEAIRSGWLTSGPVMRAFEQDFTDFLGGDVEAIAVTSATAGLHLALEALGVGPGDEVVVPTWTFTATAEVVHYVGATAVLVDIDPRTLNISPHAVRQAITDKTKAVIVVHFAGLAADMPAIREAIGNRPIALVEDAAHALPTVGPDGLVGTGEHSDAVVFSFYATKTMTTGEGGMVTTRDPRLAARMRVMRLHGIDRDAFDRYTSERPSWVYDVVAPGFKYNMPDVSAAMGRVQLTRSAAMQRRREELALLYLDALRQLPVRLPAVAPKGEVHAWHLFTIRIDEGAPLSRDAFIARMSQLGIGTSVHFIPLHRLTYWGSRTDTSQFSAAEDAFRGAVSLPIFSSMSDAESNRVVRAAEECLS
jgi:dTDP-4-amino-4,6-dideoxygalactose transaminase